MGANFGESTCRKRLRDGKAIFLHAFEMKLDCLVNEASNLGTTVTDRHAARKIRDIRAEAGRTLLNDHEIFQR